MSTVVTKNVQVGTSGTAAQNFTLYQPASPDGTVRLANGNSGTTTDLVTVTSAGNVGIGTTSPTGKLDVKTATDSKLVVHDGNTAGNVRLTAANVAFNAYKPFELLADSIQLWTNGAQRMSIDSSGMVLPATNATYDLGSASLRWRNVYTSDLHLSNGIGNYTIVEGEEDLFLYNNKNGKTYKFALIEVDKSEAPPKMKEA
jgi:hypothetical protein